MDRQSKSPLLTIAEAAEILKLKPHTLETMRWQGMGPPFSKHGGRIFYRYDELKEWSENGRRRPAAGTPRVNLRPLLGMLAGVAFVIASCLPKHPLLIWNASPSVPIGLYRIAQGFPRLGDLVLVQLPASTAMSADRRGYLPRSAYLLKPIAAVAGDRVCRFGVHIFIRRRFVALALATQTNARPMPTWHGCRTLQTGDVFLLANHPASFDGRYFGPLRAEHVVGRAIRLLFHRD